MTIISRIRRLEKIVSASPAYAIKDHKGHYLINGRIYTEEEAKDLLKDERLVIKRVGFDLEKV